MSATGVYADKAMRFDNTTVLCVKWENHPTEQLYIPDALVVEAIAALQARAAFIAAQASR